MGIASLLQKCYPFQAAKMSEDIMQADKGEKMSLEFSTTVTKRKWIVGLTVTVLIYGVVVIFAYLAGWISPRTCEGLSTVPCFLVAGWYALLVKSQEGTLLHKWSWTLFMVGWFLVGVAFLLPSGTGRIIALSSAAPTLLAGFGTTILANWYKHEEGG